MKDNMEKSEIFQIWTISILLLAGWAMTEECEQYNAQYERKRIFVAIYKGPPTPLGDEESAARNLGSCQTTREHAEKMFDHFEAYGVDLGPMRSKPYETYETAEFIITPHVVNPDANYTIMLNTFYEYAQVTNSPLLFASWLLTAKTDLSGLEKSLPTGYLANFGMVRFSDRGRDFCMGYTEWNPLPPFLSGSGIFTHTLRVENNIWGRGNLTGLTTANKGLLDGRYIIQF